jgi:hypothetical protein
LSREGLRGRADIFVNRSVPELLQMEEKIGNLTRESGLDFQGAKNLIEGGCL